MSWQARTLSRYFFPLWGPLARHVRNIQRAGNPSKAKQRNGRRNRCKLSRHVKPPLLSLLSYIA